ncbi:GNAT family N-acetyltransferase [uncultured Paraglaciecola sp.]|uniref:GNAT family N-acetyltransferase n=1 Tax=uncultured Paraglaciecola sp. TaxID=1765024 RepID=UPI0030DCB206|tara:strand:+ start:256218 stop:256751 length:534 start_codon:yes stop_codon:yes gene_type:complete
MKTLLSKNLKLRKLTIKDAEFIVELLNDPDFLKYIGDRGVKNEQDAIHYIQQGPQTMYQQHGFGLLLVESVSLKTPIGLCGLLKREELPHPDLGFAFLPQYRQKGLALDAAKLVLADAYQRKVIQKVLGITSIDNHQSINLLKKLGFTDKGLIRLKDNLDEIRLYELSNEIKTPLHK